MRQSNEICQTFIDLPLTDRVSKETMIIFQIAILATQIIVVYILKCTQIFYIYVECVLFLTIYKVSQYQTLTTSIQSYKVFLIYLKISLPDHQYHEISVSCSPIILLRVLQDLQYCSTEQLLVDQELIRLVVPVI